MYIVICNIYVFPYICIELQAHSPKGWRIVNFRKFGWDTHHLRLQAHIWRPPRVNALGGWWSYQVLTGSNHSPTGTVPN